MRHIERDLHDGAQARLVAMGITLSAAEDLISTDPEAARALLVEDPSYSPRVAPALAVVIGTCGSRCCPTPGPCR